jgi:hypothetical protein
VRQLSPGSAERSELMLWVAMIGMHFGWRERLKNFSSPVGSLSPTVAKCWYSSEILFGVPVYGELLIRPATGHATLLHPFLCVIDSKRALSFGEAQVKDLAGILERRRAARQIKTAHGTVIASLIFHCDGRPIRERLRKLVDEHSDNLKLRYFRPLSGSRVGPTAAGTIPDCSRPTTDMLQGNDRHLHSGHNLLNRLCV